MIREWMWKEIYDRSEWLVNEYEKNLRSSEWIWKEIYDHSELLVNEYEKKI
jgi:hypothetical protein